MERTLPAVQPFPVVPAARLLCLAVALLAAFIFIGLGIRNAGGPEDVYGYQLAAERLVAGESLYADPRPQDDRLTYRHAPWLAMLWVPLNLLPDPLLVWRAASFLAAVYVIVTVFRLGGHAGLILAALSLPLLGAVPHSNVGMLMLALLISRRADPWSVGVAASLKLYPLLLVLGYVAERRWRDAGIAVALTAVLWAPAVLYGIGDYVPPPSEVGLGPVAYVLAPAVLAVLGWLAWRRSRWSWVAIGAALPVIVPHYVGMQYVLVAARRLTDPAAQSSQMIWTKVRAPAAPAT
ncbi:MAG TPA: glycosyltransferase 87 family protein [candidate division Zixibacteria bacterium]|nr:glycosyltransferase 87 family protein [candidate division Zixibacteria bacterium]